ncbi:MULTISPECIES: radical SAM family heme chaperone HemW [Kordiimonas]|jgi:oxygen-independent coproporphyrinogen-3 oxidase|uniref:radical SAM family heme chaperone HemW n=1 Tax=Kordiimonas TaxID=288021 RepID=UPI00257D74F5|nr:radical SAM family heme chaperone HemW [Kordiimonas sp. UBA4487]
MPVLSPHKPPVIEASAYKGPAAIYVHWPFCLKKCPYCDFNSHVRDEVSHDRWREALVREIDSFAERFPGLSASSIFFGGGTPSLMEPDTVAAVIERVRHHWGDSKIEITLEANPSSVEAARFRAYREAGVNRLSVGIQSLRDDALKFLGRLHNASEALKALEVARANFDRVSFDLIYARPQQSLEDWRTELTEALAFSPMHLSLYQLTIEEGTAFYHQFKRGKFTLPDEDEAAALYDLTQDITEAAGLPAYETSNHAALGQESQHNLSYWRGDYYVGIGPGAHGRVPATFPGTATAHAQIKRPENWLESVEAFGFGTDTTEPVSAEDRFIETIMMGLRLKDGINLKGLEDRLGVGAKSIVDFGAAADLVASGHLLYDGETLRLSPNGRPLLNFILGKLIA